MSIVLKYYTHTLGIQRLKFSSFKVMRQFIRRNSLKNYKVFIGDELLIYYKGSYLKVSELEKLISEAKLPFRPF